MVLKKKKKDTKAMQWLLSVSLALFEKNKIKVIVIFHKPRSEYIYSPFWEEGHKT